jgi:hypothetical protein
MHPSRLWVHVAPVAMSHTGILEQSALRVDHSPTLNDVNAVVADGIAAFWDMRSSLGLHPVEQVKFTVPGNVNLTPPRSSHRNRLAPTPDM